MRTLIKLFILVLALLAFGVLSGKFTPESMQSFKQIQDIVSKVTTVKSDIEQVKSSASQNILQQVNILIEIQDYNQAKQALNELLEKDPSGEIAAQAKELIAKIEKLENK